MEPSHTPAISSPAAFSNLSPFSSHTNQNAATLANPRVAGGVRTRPEASSLVCKLLCRRTSLPFPSYLHLPSTSLSTAVARGLTDQSSSLPAPPRHRRRQTAASSSSNTTTTNSLPHPGSARRSGRTMPRPRGYVFAYIKKAVIHALLFSFLVWFFLCKLANYEVIVSPHSLLNITSLNATQLI